MVLGLTPASTERIEIEIRRRGCVGSRLLRRRIEIDEHQEGVLNPSAQISLQHLSFVCNAIGWPRLSVQIVMPSNHPFAQSFGDGLGFGVHMQLLVNAPHIPRDSARTDAGAPSHPVLAFADTSSWNDTNGHGRTDRCVAVY